MVEVEGNARPVFLCRSSDFQTELTGFSGQGGNQARHMNDLRAVFGKDTIEIKIFDVQLATDFACAIILHTWSTRTRTAVGHIDLMAIAPRSSLIKLFSFKVHVTPR